MFGNLSNYREGRSIHDQQLILEGWVAWLNSAGPNDPAIAPFRDELTRLLDEFDHARKGMVDESELAARLDTWLETAGDVGGPEREQDPTLIHPTRWHSNYHEDE